ncbi:hypothetical protein EHP00_1412 [Ecytonucleospora hepatopenaei]|uniref:Uncharacterized protein n=1 Tax=Ecytonucleospora hepatopenaei TaxID=646526 RepID=A0A1W0E689_9MICR|nr:hypothetical protein EHP00_1412 [Ecytonucleospora hepatopenaei]
MTIKENSKNSNIEHTDEGSDNSIKNERNDLTADQSKDFNSELKSANMTDEEVALTKKDLNENKLKQWLKKLAWGSIIYYTVITVFVLVLSLFAICGFASLSFEYASFYFNALRCYDDEDLSKNAWLSIDIVKKTMRTKGENRYFDVMQPSNQKKGACMAGSWYVPSYQEVFPITQMYNYRCYKTENAVLLDNENVKNRFHAMRLLFDDKLLHSWLINDPISKLSMLPVTKKKPMDTLKNDANIASYVKKLLVLIDDIKNEFKAMHSENKNEQKFYFEMDSNNKEVVASADLKVRLEEIINELPIKEKMAEGGKKDLELKHLLKGVMRLGKANPTILDSLVIGKIINWGVLCFSDITFEDLDSIKKFKEKREDYDKAEKTFKKQNKDATDKEVTEALRKNHDQLSVMRATYLARVMSMMFANMLKSKKLETRKKFPFSKEKDPRSSIKKAFSISAPKEKTEEALEILEAVLKKKFTAVN